MKFIPFIFVFTFLCTTSSLFAQTSLSLDNMDAFKSQAGNWQIVGAVVMDREIDIHTPPPPPPPPETGKKKKKKKKGKMLIQPVVEHREAVTFSPGTGILLNMNDKEKKTNLQTVLEHGDIELELEVMIPRGSNSGIYLQGRYEVQLFDSWGVKNPGFTDIGGIYRNWEEEPGQIYRGKPPLTNPAKAPGLWQTFHIMFQAPRFDANGNKTANAKFVFVDLNGVRIHNNVAVPLPTGGPIEKNEVAKGPIMIQGDHGPVAIRNIRYKLLSDTEVEWQDLSYKTFEGVFQKIEDFNEMKPLAEGKLPEISMQVLNTENEYALSFTGHINIKKADTYTIRLGYTGGAVLVLNGKKLIDFQSPTARRTDQASIELEPGTYPVEVYNYKTAAWLPPRLGLFVEATSSYPKNLHEYDAFPENLRRPSPIFIEVGNSPRLVRAFLDFKGERKNRLTHTIAVGDQGGIHYAYDLASGNLVCGWRGDFVNATPMWHNRGDGSFRPRGAVQYTFLGQPLAYLESESSPFPGQGEPAEFKPGGYKLHPDTGQPIFSYTYREIEVQSSIVPMNDRNTLLHEITVSEADTTGHLSYKLAEGSDILKMPDGSFAINDQEYYINIETRQQPIIREINGRKELITRMDQKNLMYSIIW